MTSPHPRIHPVKLIRTRPAATAALSVAILVGSCLIYRGYGADPSSPAKAAEIKTGVDQGLNGRQVFPPDDPWNTDVSREPVDPNSEALIASIGVKKGLHPDFGTTMQDAHGNAVPNGIPYVIVSGSQPKVPVTFEYKHESDPGPYPIPPDAPIEGGPGSDGDRHILVIDKDNWKLYETWSTYPLDGGKSFKAGSGAIFDLKKNSVQRPAGWTSSDAAGLPVFAGLARYDEIVERGKLTHALRFTVVHSRHGYVSPATHFASNKTNTDLPPMGMRVRLKASFDTSKFPATARVILDGLKTYGMILADNGSDWFITGAPDPRWKERQGIRFRSRQDGGRGDEVGFPSAAGTGRFPPALLGWCQLSSD
jgi:hypothetical protein